MKIEYNLFRILVVIPLATGLWIFQITSEYQRLDQEYVKETDEEEKDQKEWKSEKVTTQRHLPLILKHYSRLIRISERGSDSWSFRLSGSTGDG